MSFINYLMMIANFSCIFNNVIVLISNIDSYWKNQHQNYIIIYAKVL